MAAFCYLQSLQHWTTYSKDLRSALNQPLRILKEVPYYKFLMGMLIMCIIFFTTSTTQQMYCAGGLAWLHETNQPNEPTNHHPEAAPSSASCCKKILANASLPTKAAPPKGVKPASTRVSFQPTQKKRWWNQWWFLNSQGVNMVNLQEKEQVDWSYFDGLF